jgi:hypothetical protein
MLDDRTLDRLIGLLWCLDARSLSARLRVAGDASSLLAAAGLSWGDVLPALRAGNEALAQRLTAAYSPETLAWAAGPDWGRLDGGPGEPRVLRYHDPDWGHVAEVRECRSSCRSYAICSQLRPRRGDSIGGRIPPASRWRTVGPDTGEGEEPFFCGMEYGGYACHPDLLTAQLAIYNKVYQWREEDLDEPTPEKQQTTEAGT